jgi:hypothetical protein
MTGTPVLTVGDLVRGPEGIRLPVPADRLSFWYSGRTAIWQGLAWLGLGTGDRVLAPAYTCGAEIDALLGAGLVVDYYRSGNDLTPDLDDLTRLCASPARALLVTHFFGVAQPMDALLAFAGAHGLRVIEDAAHGLYSTDEKGRPLGSRGDVGVWSFNKTLAVPDGGALIVNGGGREGPGSGERPSLLRVGGRMRWLVETAAAQQYPALTDTAKRWMLDPLVAWTKALDERRTVTGDASPARDREPFAFRHEQARWRMSTWARRLLARALPGESVVDRRRRNYTALEQGLQGAARARPFFPALPDGCCPLVYPLMTDDGPGLRAHLLAHGVFVYLFGFFHGAIPWPRFPLEVRLKRDLLLLPLHQGLDGDDMAHLAALVHGWERETA